MLTTILIANKDMLKCFSLEMAKPDEEIQSDGDVTLMIVDEKIPAHILINLSAFCYFFFISVSSFVAANFDVRSA